MVKLGRNLILEKYKGKTMSGLNDITFEINSLGAIKEAKVHLNELTSTIGPNSSSKTYINYLIYGFLNYILTEPKYLLISELYNLSNQDLQLASFIMGSKEAINKLKLFEDALLQHLLEKNRVFRLDVEDLQGTISSIFKGIAQLSKIFARREIGIIGGHSDLSLTVNELESIYDLSLNGVLFNIQFIKPKESYQIDFICMESVLELSPKSIKENIVPTLVTKMLQTYFEQILPRPILITSERTGVSFFYEKLKSLRGAFQTSTTIDDKVVYQILNKESYEHIESALYQQAVLDNITLLGDLINSNKSSYFTENGSLEITQFIEKEINRGSYEIVQHGGALADKKLQFKLQDGNAIEINAASSSIKSLLLLDLYIKKMAQPGDLLIIDEPELNLHPSNQRKIARLLAMLANNGVKVMFTTHSDYLMNEINNLIKLNELGSETQGKILAKYALSQSALINKENISANYINRTEDGCVLSQCEIIDGTFEYKTFDDEISNLNNFADEIQDFYIAETNAKLGANN